MMIPRQGEDPNLAIKEYQGKDWYMSKSLSPTK